MDREAYVQWQTDDDDDEPISFPFIDIGFSVGAGSIRKETIKPAGRAMSCPFTISPSYLTN